MVLIAACVGCQTATPLKVYSDAGKPTREESATGVNAPVIESHILAAPDIRFPPNRPTEQEFISHTYPFTRDQIETLKAVIRYIDREQKGDGLLIIGHTDDLECRMFALPVKNSPDEKLDERISCGVLAERRARVVAERLFELGVNPQRFTPVADEPHPIAFPYSDANRTRNRAVQFVNAGKENRESYRRAMER